MLNKSVIAQILIDAGADVNISDNNQIGSLHYSLQYCKNIDIFYKLVQKGADINHLSNELYTPFHYAVLYKCHEVPFYLIDKSVDYRLIKSCGENAIHLAAFSGCDSIFDFLVQQGLDYNSVDNSGNTPLMLALRNNSRSVANKLLDMGVDVMIENKKHQMPIFYAVTNNDPLSFNRLIEKGTIVNIQSDSVSPIYAAAAKENTYFVEVLLRNGAENPMKCDYHDICYQTAFIYSVNASIADDEQKLGLYQNSLNIFNLAKEKYKSELNKIRAKNTAKVCGQACLMFGGAATGNYYVTTGVDYETARRGYLKYRLDKCDVRIKELQTTISSMK